MVYLLPDGAELADARALFKAHVGVTAGRIRAGTRTFYDTFDGRLHGAGLTLRHHSGRLTLTDRTAMRFPMLLGRRALAGRFVVDPSRRYVSGKPKRKRKS